MTMTVRALALACLLAMAAAACGGDDGGDEPGAASAGSDRAGEEAGDDDATSSDDDAGAGGDTDGAEDAGDEDDGTDGNGGGDEGGDDRDAYVAALVATMETDVEFPEDSRECVAGALLDAVGFEELAAVVTPDEIREEGSSFDPAESGLDLTTEQGEAYYAGLTECVDVRQVLLASLAEDLDAESAACVGEAVTEDVARVFVVTSFTGEDAATAEPEVMGEFEAAVTPCLGSE